MELGFFHFSVFLSHPNMLITTQNWTMLFNMADLHNDTRHQLGLIKPTKTSDSCIMASTKFVSICYYMIAFSDSCITRTRISSPADYVYKIFQTV